MKKTIVTTAALFLPLLTSQADEEKKITTVELPAAVLATVEKETPKAKFSAVSMEKEDGKVLYEVTFRKDDHEHEIKLNAEGKIVERETVIALKEAPEKVRAAIAAKLKGHKIGEIEKVIVDGMTTFEVEATEDEEESVEMKFSADGTFLSKDADDDDDDKEEKE